MHATTKNTTARRARMAIGLAMVSLSLVACDEVRPSMEHSREMTLQEFSSDIRWSDFDTAYNLVDPKYKIEHPMTDLERERYRQIEISSYEVDSSSVGTETYDQQVRLEIINRHTQIPRTMTYHEHWRWDAELKKWWLTTGLPEINSQD
jgi:hypothetical protein